MRKIFNQKDLKNYLNQIKKFDKNFVSIYYLKLLSNCIDNKNLTYKLNIKKFRNFLKNHTKIKNPLQTKKNIDTIFIREVLKNLEKLEKLNKKFYFFFNFKRIVLSKFIFEIYNLNTNYKKSKNKFDLNKLYKKIYNINEDKFNNKISFLFSLLSSKVFENIIKITKERGIMRIFFNSFLAVNINSNLFENFQIKKNLIKSSLVVDMFNVIRKKPLGLK